MNILVIPSTFGLTKPISGGQSRFFNIVKQLKNKDNKIVVLESYCVTDHRDRKLTKIYSYKDYKFYNRRLTIFRDINIDFILKIIKILKNERIDLIQIAYPSGVLAAKVITHLTRNKIPIVYDAHNVESNFVLETFAINPRYSKLERLIMPIYIKFSEKIVCKYIVNQVTSVSEKEREIFIERYKCNKEKVTVVPSGCYIFKLPDKKCKNNVKEEFGIDSDKLIIFFHGLYSFQNKDAFEAIESYIAPKFERINESVLFVIGGTGVPKYERANIKSLGFIEDLHSVLAVADISIVPLIHGAGTKLKIFDYMGAGLPIVTTKKGIEGIKVKNREHALIVNDVNEEFINAIKYLIDNEQERRRIGANARRLAEEEYDWDKIGEKLDKLYKTIRKNIKYQRSV